MNTFTASYGDASASSKPVQKASSKGTRVKPAVKVEPTQAQGPAAKPAVGSTNLAAKPAAGSTNLVPEPEKPKFYVKKLGALFTFQ